MEGVPDQKILVKYTKKHVKVQDVDPRGTSNIQKSSNAFTHYQTYNIKTHLTIIKTHIQKVSNNYSKTYSKNGKR